MRNSYLPEDCYECSLLADGRMFVAVQEDPAAVVGHMKKRQCPVLVLNMNFGLCRRLASSAALVDWALS